MFNLYSIGNTNTKVLSTPEVRDGKKKKDTDLVMALTLLPIAFNKTRLKKYISKGAKRYKDMQTVYLRAIDLTDEKVKESIVSLSLLNTSLEKEWKEKHPKTSDAKKRKYLKDKGLTGLSLSDVLYPKGILKEELDKVSDVAKKIAEGNKDIESKYRGSLHVGIPYFRVTIRKPLPVTKTAILLTKAKKKKKTQESIFFEL